MATWPASLPEYVLENGFSETMPEQAIESQTDGGPAKIRRRFTTNFRPLKFTIRVEPELVETFETFYFETLEGGTLPFSWVHPRTRAACNMRFRRPAPTIRPIGTGEAVDISMSVEIMP